MSRSSRGRRSVSSARASGIAVLIGTVLSIAACRREEAKSPPPLPGEDDLYRYSLAIAERARFFVGKDDPIATYYLGKVHDRFGLEERAIAIYEQVIAQAPETAEAHRDLATILSNHSERMADAIRHYQQSLTHDPDYPGVRTRIGMLLLHLGELDEAHAILREEVERDTADSVTWLHLGQVENLRGSFDKAAANYRKALELDPEMREALYGLARVLRATGDVEAATKADERFRELKAKDDLRDIEIAKERKDSSEEERRNTALTWLDASQLYLRETRKQGVTDVELWNARARDACANALRFDPTQVAAHRFILDWHLDRNELARATSAARQAVAAIPSHPYFRFELARLITNDVRSENSKESEGAIAEAIEHLRVAVESAEDFAPAHAELARVILFFQRKPELIREALHHAERALEISSMPEPLHFDLVSMGHFFLGNRDKACAALRKGCETFPHDAGLRARLAKLEGRSR